MRNLTATNSRSLMRAQNAIAAIMFGGFLCIAISPVTIAQTERHDGTPSAAARRAPIGIGTVVVHPALGGIILGYDIDQNGTEGLLSEFVALAGGKSNIAVETFDQQTGAIVKIVTEQMDTKNSWLTFGVFGSHVGLAEFEHVTHLFVDGLSLIHI